MPNYVDLGARLLALRKMAFPSADKALSYCRSLGMPGLRAKKVTRGRLFYEVGDEIRTVHILIHGISNVIVHSFDGTTFTLYENDGFTMCGLSETFSGDMRFGATIRAKTDCCVLEIAVAPFLAAVQHDVVLANIVIGSLAQQLYFNLETNSRKVLVSKEESLVVYLYQHSRGALPLRLRTTRPALAGMLGINLRTLYRYTDKLVAAGALSLERGKLCITQENHVQLEKLYQQIMKKMAK